MTPLLDKLSRHQRWDGKVVVVMTQRLAMKYYVDAEVPRVSTVHGKVWHIMAAEDPATASALM